MSSPQPNPGILDIAPYTPGKTPQPMAGRKVFKLSANETPLGPSPKAVAAFTAAAAHLEDYPEGTSRVLREAIGRVFGLDPDRIICGAGSDEILNLLAHTYLGQGDEAVMTTHGFLVYPIATKANGATPVIAPEREFTAEVDAILARVTPRTKLVWLANPNNPTGTWYSAADFEAFLAAVPAQVLVVVDEAYAEFVDAPDYASALPLLAEHPNLVVTRTFSKAHALAGLRVGYALAHPDCIAVMERVRESFNVNAPGLAAAQASLADAAHLAASLAANRAQRQALADALRARGLAVSPSQTNFLLVEFGDDTARIEAALLARGVILRPMGGYGLGDCLRITVGTQDDNTRLLAALDEVLA